MAQEVFFMNQKNIKKAKIILIVYLVATLALLFLGYSVQSPKIAQQEFPFTITYSYQGQTETISDVYVVEYTRSEKYIGDNTMGWFGYIKDHNRLELDWYTIDDADGRIFSINLNLVPGYLMGDSAYTAPDSYPTLESHYYDGTNDIVVTDPAELKQMGFSLVSWEYPQAIENTFSFGGISLSSQGTVLTSVLAVVMLLACLILIKRDREITYGILDKISIVLNILIIFVAFPFILVVSMLSEIVAEATAWQQILYLAPALTASGVAASLTLRRCGYGKLGFFLQFVGFLAFVPIVLV